MALKKWSVAVTGLLWLAACEPSDDADSAHDGGIVTQPPPGSDGSVSPGGGNAGGGNAGGGNAGGGNSGGGGLDDAGPGGADAGGQPGGGDASEPTPAGYDYENQSVELTSDLVIPKGKTVRVGPGVKFNAKAASVKIDVQGQLLVEGTAAAPVSFVGPSANEKSWTGIQVAAGADLKLSHATFSGAKYAIFTNPGSTYTLDRVTVDTSFKAAVLQSEGTLSNCIVKAVALFPQITNDVTIDDANGALTIINASPAVTNCRFEGSGGLNDMIRVGGQASPTFDHISVTKSHCAFHTNGGTNTSMRVTNSLLENLAYGVMAYAAKPIFENNVFKNNSNDVGFCFGAKDENAPLLSKNFFPGGALKLDAECERIKTKDTAPASSAPAGVGPSGL